MGYVSESGRFQVQLPEHDKVYQEENVSPNHQAWEAMSIRELRAECARLHIDVTDCFDKDSILKQLRTCHKGKAKISSDTGYKLVNLKEENLSRLEVGLGDTVR